MTEAIIAFLIGMFGTYTVLDIAHAKMEKKRREMLEVLNLHAR